MITLVGVPVEEVLSYIVINSGKVVVHMECGGEAYWVISLGELWYTHSVDPWIDPPPSLIVLLQYYLVPRKLLMDIPRD